MIDRLPCTVKLLPVPKGSTDFHDFGEFERLVEAARLLDPRTHLIILLGGEAGLRCGEMVALEWSEMDLANPQLTVSRSDWNGLVTTPKGGRPRHLPMESRGRSFRRARGGRPSARTCCTGSPRSSGGCVHILRHTFCSHLAMRGAPTRGIQELAGHKDLSMTQRYMHLSPAALDAAIRLLEQPAGPRDARGSGDMLETGEEGANSISNSGLNWR